MNCTVVTIFKPRQLKLNISSHTS